MALTPARGVRLAILASAVAVSLGVAGACTVFNGVSVTACSVQATGYLSLSEAARACNYIMSCDPTGQFMVDIESSIGVVTSSTSFAYCMNAVAGSIPSTRPGTNVAGTSLACIANAPSCAAAKACMGIESIDDVTTDPRCGPSAHVPDSGIYCTDGGGDIVDCTDTGGFIEHCAQPPFVGEGTCIIPPNDPDNYFCGDNGGGYPGCTACDISSSLLTFCEPDSSLEGFVQCAALGQTCAEVPFTNDAGQADASPQCITNGTYTFCDPDTFSDECVDGSVGTCSFWSTVSPTDCVALGDKCVQGNQPFCSPPSASCTPFTPGIGQCQGDAISLCIDGKPFTFDCRCAGMECKSGSCVSGKD